MSKLGQISSLSGMKTSRSLDSLRSRRVVSAYLQHSPRPQTTVVGPPDKVWCQIPPLYMLPPVQPSEPIPPFTPIRARLPTPAESREAKSMALLRVRARILLERQIEHNICEAEVRDRQRREAFRKEAVSSARRALARPAPTPPHASLMTAHAPS